MITDVTRATPDVPNGDRVAPRSTSHVLDPVRVGDCMHPGVLSCGPDTPLSTVAQLMTDHHVHAVYVSGSSGPAKPLVCDLDVLDAVASVDDGLVVRQIAVTQAVTASTDAPIREAAGVMADHGARHLIVLDAADGHPVGVLSTTDVIAAYARATLPQPATVD